jgi:hypothetical protein
MITQTGGNNNIMKYLCIVIFAMMVISSFEKKMYKYTDNTLLIQILDIVIFILVCSMSNALEGNIFSSILIIIITVFIIFIYYDVYRFKECSSGNKDFIIYPFILLSLYFYLNQYIKINKKLTIRKLADCTYSSFAKTLMILCIMLSLSYRSIDMFIFSSILFFYMLST